MLYCKLVREQPDSKHSITKLMYKNTEYKISSAAKLACHIQLFDLECCMSHCNVISGKKKETDIFNAVFF